MMTFLIPSTLRDVCNVCQNLVTVILSSAWCTGRVVDGQNARNEDLHYKKICCFHQ
jgi:hypothetical protein